MLYTEDMPIADLSPTLLVPLLAAVVAIPFLWLGMRAERRYRLIHDMPTCRTSGVFVGFVELEGRAISDTPLVSFLSHSSCVYYKWSIEESWSRWETERYTDKDGKSKTRRVHKSGWTTVADGGKYQYFYLQDDHGHIRVNPVDAKIEDDIFLERTCGESDALYYEKGPASSIRDSDHRRRFRETGILLQTHIYIIGQSRIQDDAVAVEIATDTHAPLFLISTRSQGAIARSYRLGAFAWLIGGGIISILLCAFFIPHNLSQQPFSHDDLTQLRIIASLWCAGVYLSACLCGWIWMVYNGLTELHHRVIQAWSNIDIELKRRATLIPNLMSIVAGLTTHEQDTHLLTTTLRSQLQVTPPGQIGANPEACGPRLQLLAEAYPELMAQEQFSALHHSLINCEDRIALARGYFNDMATHLNTRLALFPDRLVATLTRISPQSLMQDDGFTRNAPRVTL